MLHGWEVEIIQDVLFDRRSRHETEMFGGVDGIAVQSREPSLRNDRNGLRGVRVVEEPPKSDKEAPDEVLDDLEFELGRIDRRSQKCPKSHRTGFLSASAGGPVA